MKAKISIIMPSYNVVEYIDKCLDSVLSQNLKDIEIICIDANSVDGTTDILKKYANSDGRIQIINSEKKSYGAQVNRGIDASSGEYIAILETDDCISCGMYERLYDSARLYSLDYCKMNWQSFSLVKNGYRYCENRIWDDKNRYGCILIPSEDEKISTCDCTIWSGIYDRNFIINNNIRLNESPGAAYQDIGFLMQVYEKAERAMYIDEIGYCYRYNRPGASTWNKNVLKYVTDEWNYLEELGIISERVLLRLCASFLCETDKLLKMVGFDSNSPLITPYLLWVSDKMQGIENAYLGSETDNSFCRLKMMISDFKNYVDLAKTKFENDEGIKQQISDFLNGADCIIFGSGSYGRRLYNLLEWTSENIMCYCDNSAERIGDKIGAYDILLPADAIKQYPHCKFIIANKNSAVPMKKQINEYGISDADIFVYC